MKKRITCVGLGCFAGVLITLVATGCAGYHSGTLMHPQVKSIYVQPVKNQSSRPELTSLMRSGLSRHLMQDGSLKVVPREKADAVLHARIIDADVASVGSAEVRSEQIRESDRDAYQTTVYEARVKAEYKLTIPGREKPVLSWHSVESSARFSELPDRVESEAVGFRQATDNTAREMTYSLTEAW